MIIEILFGYDETIEWMKEWFVLWEVLQEEAANFERAEWETHDGSIRYKTKDKKCNLSKVCILVCHLKLLKCKIGAFVLI